jgi:hypothetical protein
MAQTITPVVNGGRRAKWAGVLGFHALGATLSAALLGAALGAAGRAVGAPWGVLGVVAVIGVAGAYALRELAGLSVPIPELRRQVPEWWRSAFSPGTAAALYGLGLGVGFATHLRHGTLVAVAGASLASGDPLAGAVAMGAFGLARSLAVGAAWLSAHRRDVGALTDALERLAVRPGIRILNGTALGAVVVVGVASAAFEAAADIGRVMPAATLALAAVFGLAAAGKVLRWRAWRRALTAYRIPASLEGATAVAVPLAEAAVPVSILTGVTDFGAGLALALLLGFSGAVLRAARTEGHRLPCGCFGRAGSRSVRAILVRNLAMAALAAAAVASDGSPLPSFGPGDAVPALLASVGVALTAVLLIRAGRILRRDLA